MSNQTPFWKTRESIKLVSWPSPQDYNEAVQNPHTSFTDAELRGGQPEVTALGLPRPMTGAFASVYRLKCDTRDWAVRCFLHDVADQNFRYEQISKTLKEAQLPYTAGFEFIDEGINVRSSWFPILKMEWVEGDSLIRYIEKNLDKPRKFAELNQRFHQMMNDLQAAGIAHGDLQHGNIIIENGQFRLVDYDGMFVSTLSGRGANELGHRNYQHPARASGHFGMYLDNFSAWVIHTSLACLAADSSLWLKLKAGDECLLFKQNDLANPARSKVFYELERHASVQVSTAAKRLRALLAMRPEDIPQLQDAEIIDVSDLPEVIPEAPPPVPLQPERQPRRKQDADRWLSNQLESGPGPHQPPAAPRTSTLSFAVPIFIWSVILMCLVGSLALNTYSAIKHALPVPKEDRFPLDQDKPAHQRLNSNSSLTSPLNRGHIKFMELKYEEAAKLYEEHINSTMNFHPNWKMKPQYENEIAEAQYHLGLCRFHQKRFEQAILPHLSALDLYKNIDAIAYADEIQTLHNQLAIEFSRLGQFENAAVHLQAILNNSVRPAIEHNQLVAASELLATGKYMFVGAGSNHAKQQHALTVIRSAQKVLGGNTQAHSAANRDLLKFAKQLKDQHKNAESQLIYALLSPQPDRIVGTTKKTKH